MNGWTFIRIERFPGDANYNSEMPFFFFFAHPLGESVELGDIQSGFGEDQALGEPPAGR